jgi:hypothetical protein
MHVKHLSHAVVAAALWMAAATAATGSPVVRPGTVARSQPNRAPALSADVVYSAAPTADGGVLVTAAADGLTISKTVYADGRSITEVASPGDTLRLEIDHDALQLVRGRARHRVDGRSTSPEADLAKVRRTLADSPALGRLRAVAARMADVDVGARPHALAVLLTDALLGYLDGDVGAPARLARQLTAKTRSGLRTVRRGCYSAWEAQVMEASYELESCINDFSWYNYVADELCTIRWTLQVEVAWWSLISCASIPIK